MSTNSQQTEENKFSSYIYRWLVSIRVILWVHVFYSFAITQAADSGKWWTFIEATSEPVSFLPYTNSSNSTKLYQHLLFEPCVEPIFSWSDIGFENALCNVESDDYKTFSVTVPAQHTWSDWEPLTIEDVYFTYNTILKDNVWNVDSAEPYKNISIQVDWSQLIFNFPSESIDNMIFFTNFILPQHILANRDYDFYTETFARNVVNSSCSALQLSENDLGSVIFDLSDCEDYPIKFYQVKYFPDTETLWSYVESNPENIDLMTHDLSDQFTENHYITSQITTAFFNTSSDKNTKNIREYTANLLKQIPYSESHIIKDHYLFGEVSDEELIEPVRLKEIYERALNSAQDAPEEDIRENQAARNDSLTPDSIITFRKWSAPLATRITQEISNRFPLNITLEETYTKVTVAHNGWVEYTLQSFDTASWSAVYNLSPSFRNIAEWENSYEVIWYTWDEKDRYIITIEYLGDEPVVEDIEEENDDDNEENEEEEATPTDNPLNVIYFEDEHMIQLVKSMRTYLQEHDLDTYFRFEWFTDSDELAGKIASWAYDIVLKTINLWLRKDLSNLFISENASINPSKYTSEKLATNINEYFRSSSTKQKQLKIAILDSYNANIPLLFLGKQKEAYYLNSEITSNPFPERVYSRWWRKQYLKNIEWFNHTNIDWDKVFNLRNFFNFLMWNESTLPDRLEQEIPNEDTWDKEQEDDSEA